MKNAKELVDIVKDGLVLDNLHKLIDLCKVEVQGSNHPLVPFILISVFSGLVDEWNNQAIHAERYKEIENALSEQLIEVIELSSQKTLADMFSSLNKLILNYMKLS